MVLVSVLVVAVVAVVGCGEDCSEIQTECERIANDIRRAAAQRGISSLGICTSTSPRIQADFGAACTKLSDCNRRVDECQD